MINSERIVIRLLEEADLELRVKWFNDPKVNKFLVSDYPMGLAKTRRWFQSTLTDESKLNLSIVDKATGNLIGMTGFLNINFKHAHAQFYITIGEEEYRGIGLSNEIIPAVLSHGFNFLRLNKIYLWTLVNNSHARTVYERNGFKREAVLKDFLHCRGDFQDVVQHCILYRGFLEMDVNR
jgi:RimJ/RimL family protein N-acetyltransferase